MPTLTEEIKSRNKARVFKQGEWYGIRSLLGNSNWALFYVMLGSRESGKSYAAMEYFVKQWKQKGIPFYWLRLNEASMKKMLNNNAEKFVDADLYRKYGLKLTVKGNTVFDNGKKMATVLALSTFANDKGVALFDKDFLSDPNMEYHVCLDEFQLENTQKSQGDIAYQFVNQMENILRSTKQRTKIFLIGNTLSEAADILCMFNFIPETYGRYKLKKKRCVIDYLPNSVAYNTRRKGTIADILCPNASNFTNEIKFDESLVCYRRLIKPTQIIIFDKQTKYTVWDGNIIAPYHNEQIKNTVAMRPYQDELFNVKARDEIILRFDNRLFYYKNLITAKKFQKEIQLIKPRKQ